MEYNTTRDRLIISEYGRNVQSMVKYIARVEDVEKRNQMAHTMISIMANMHPDNRDQSDYKQKLWDHMIIMSDFTLEVDNPYPNPPRPQDAPKPKRVSYTQEDFMFRPYGKYIQRIIEKATEIEDGPEKDELVHVIANNLKKMYLNWNRDSVNDELIYEHLSKLSDGNLKLAEEHKLHSTSDILKAHKKSYKDMNGKDKLMNGKNRNRHIFRGKKDN
jgi:hypothetical protein